MNDYKTIAKGIVSAILILLSGCLLIWLLYKVSSIIIFFTLASILSLIGKPIVTFLTSKFKFNKTIASTVTIILFVLLLTTLISLFIPMFIEQGKNLSFINTDYLAQNINYLKEEASLYLKEQGIYIDDYISKIDLMSSLKLDYIPSFFNSIINLVASFTIGTFSVLFITFYLLKENNLIGRFLLAVINDKHHDSLSNSIVSIKEMLSRYFIGLFLQIIILFIFYFLTLYFLDIPNAGLIAFLCACLNLIPYLGPLIGVILMLTLSLTSIITQDFDLVILPTAMYIVMFYGLAQLIDNFISQPIIFSKSTKSHPLEIFIVLLIFGYILGIIGMVIGIPFYTSLKIISKEFYANNKIVKAFTKNL